MGWTVAFGVAAAVSAIATTASGISQAKAQATQAHVAAINAEIAQLQYESNADLAELEALQQERQRREEARFVSGEQIAMAAALGIPVGFSESFAAIQRKDQQTLRRDIKAIRLLGKEKSFRYRLGGEAAGVEASFLRSRSRASTFGAILAGAGSIAGDFARYQLLGGSGGSGSSSGISITRTGSSLSSV